MTFCPYYILSTEVSTVYTVHSDIVIRKIKRSALIKLSCQKIILLDEYKECIKNDHTTRVLCCTLYSILYVVRVYSSGGKNKESEFKYGNFISH